ncbi:MAG TPA: ATP-binding protein, partial [Syntrophorhabdaceae bacterium]|nr:ATP-binding protein [Syntrophorhabdaceae bacterium]
DRKWYSFYVFRIGGPESRRIGNTFQDITERKKADEALIHQWRLMQRIMDELPVAVSIVQGNDLRIQYTNPAFRIMAPDRELVGRTTTQAMSGGQPHIDNVLLEVLTTGETYTEIDQPYPVVRSPKSHSELAYFTSSVSRILMPDANWGLLITFVETTGRKSIEEELRRSKDELELRMKKADSILNSITDSYFELDKEWRFISVNDNALNHFGRTKEEVIGQLYFDVLPQAGGSVYEDQYTKVMAGSEAHFEVGSIALLPTKWFEIHAYPSEEKGISVYFRDITERKGMEEELRRSKDELEICVQKRTEELRRAYEQLYNQTKEREAIEKQLRQSQKMEAIGTLAGGIAHDFNNILAGIIGFAEMVEEDLPPESKSRKYIQRVLKASERGKDLVRQILTFSRKTDLERTPVSLKNLIKETRHLLRASIPSTIEIEVNLQAKNDNVLAAPAELQQVLMNLVTNAVAAMKDKGGTMTVSTADHDLAEGPAIKIDVQPGSYIQLSVTDTGVGIPGEIKDKIFEPFFTTKEVGQGTGMGLAVVYAIVRNLGGNVTVESTEGVGSIFNVFLPVATVTSHETARTEELPRGDESILFVDDEDTLVSWGEDVLQRLGYTVTAVTDPRRALSLFSVEPFKFDIIILDQTMPKLTGFDLAKKMLEIRADLPIILCTGHSDIVSEAMAKNAGIKEFLMKPVRKKSLADAIRTVLK